MPTLAVILPAAGSSTRFGGPRSKLVEDLAGLPVITRAVLPFAQRSDTRQIFIAVPNDPYAFAPCSPINAPADRTFAFFSKAENLGLLTPASMKFSIDGIAPAMQTGSVIDYHIALGPVPVRWRTRIAEWESGRSFVDIQDKGPYQLWRHRHRFREEGGRTLMDDQVLYTPPFGPLGRIAHWLFIAPALRRIFQYRSDVIRLRFG